MGFEVLAVLLPQVALWLLVSRLQRNWGERAETQAHLNAAKLIALTNIQLFSLNKHLWIVASLCLLSRV